MRRIIIKHPKTVLFDAIIDAFGNIYIKKYIDSIYLEIIKYVIKGEYEIEFEDSIFKINENNVFKNLEKLKEEPNYKNKLEIRKVTANDILEYTNQKIPVDLEDICNFFNIELKRNNQLKFDGLSSYKKDKYYILYKSGISSPYRERFTIAHELGHIFLHFSEDFKIFEDSFQDKIDNLDIQKLAARGLNNISKRKLEKEADEFAASLLMPEKEIINTIFNSKHFITIDKLADHFKVSKQAIKIRLISMGLYNPLME